MVTRSPKGLRGFNSPEGVLPIPLLLQLGLQNPQKDTIMEPGTAAVVARGFTRRSEGWALGPLAQEHRTAKALGGEELSGILAAPRREPSADQLRAGGLPSPRWPPREHVGGASGRTAPSPPA